MCICSRRLRVLYTLREHLLRQPKLLTLSWPSAPPPPFVKHVYGHERAHNEGLHEGKQHGHDFVILHDEVLQLQVQVVVHRSATDEEGEVIGVWRRVVLAVELVVWEEPVVLTHPHDLRDRDLVGARVAAHVVVSSQDTSAGRGESEEDHLWRQGLALQELCGHGPEQRKA